jgi:hypothetical protein
MTSTPGTGPLKYMTYGTFVCVCVCVCVCVLRAPAPGLGSSRSVGSGMMHCWVLLPRVTTALGGEARCTPRVRVSGSLASD